MSSISRLVMSAGHYHFLHRSAPYVAVAKGFFKQEGLSDFDIRATGQDEFTLQGLKNGTIHLALDVKPVVLLPAVARGEKLYIVGGFVNGLRFVVTGKKSIKTVEDLRGKRLGVIETGGGIGWRQTRVLLRKHGIDPDKDVSIVKGCPFESAENVMALLEKGTADTMTVYYVDLPKLVKAGYPIIYDFKESYPDGYAQRVMVTTEDIITNRRDELKAALRGIIRGFRFIRRESNYQETMKIVHESMNDRNERFLGWEGLDPSWLLEDHYVGFKEVPLDGGTTIRGLQVYIDEEIAEGHLPTTFRMEQVTRLDLQKEACREVDERFGPYKYE